jgi:hypothetical protein
MKKISIIFILIISGFITNAQLEKGNVLIGTDISNIDLSLNTGSNFSATLNPKAAWFIHENIAVGGYLNFGIVTAKNAGTSITYGIGPLARYYVNDPKINPVQHARFFLEGNAGIEGSNPAYGNSTNGLGIGVGPGMAYFVTPNIGLEALLKYSLIVGFGSSVTSSDLLLNFGFQIYLPSKSIEKAAKNQQ